MTAFFSGIVVAIAVYGLTYVLFGSQVLIALLYYMIGGHLICAILNIVPPFYPRATVWSALLRYWYSVWWPLYIYRRFWGRGNNDD